VTVIRLGSHNVFAYLLQKNICQPSNAVSSIEQLIGKNLNLLVHLSAAGSGDKITARYVVKQGPVGRSGIPKDGFEEEWRFARLLQSHGELADLQAVTSEPIFYDEDNEIIVYRFFEHYQDLGDFYAENQLYPTAVATAMGIALASLHRATFQRNHYLLELDPDLASHESRQLHRPNYHRELTYLTPSIFQRVSVDGLRFYQICQRAEDLTRAISHLEATSQHCCLIHGDLKFNNILLHRGWQSWQRQGLLGSTSSLLLAEDQTVSVVRLIDWEQWKWGDLAFDVGALVADYLRLWLKSLMLDSDLDLAMVLKFAAVPLETVQPSIQAFLRAYVSQFPEIIDVFPDFMNRLFQFAGLGLIRMIQDGLHYHEPFDAVEKCMLQVAKLLLCQPVAAQATILGSASLDFSGVDSQDVKICPTSPVVKRPHSGQKKCVSQVPPPLWMRNHAQDLMLTDLVENICVGRLQIAHPAYEPLNFVWPGGGECKGKGSEQGPCLSESLQRAYHLTQLRNYIHDIYFSGEQEQRCSARAPAQQLINNTIAGLDINFLGLLQEANHSTGFFDPDWLVVAAKMDRVQIQKDGLHLWVAPSTDLTVGVMPPGSSSEELLLSGDLMVGTSVCLRMPNSLFAGDYYIAVGNQGEPMAEQPRISVTFTIAAAGAPVLLEALSRHLNHATCRFILKILNEPSQYGRFNAAILEMEARSYPVLRSILEVAWGQISPYLSDPVPLFTYRLAAGIGLFESPQQETDFGLSRCELLAQALLDSHSQAYSRREMIRIKFIQQRLDWSKPHLNPGSKARYAPLTIVASNQDASELLSLPGMINQLDPKVVMLMISTDALLNFWK
jgi:hypothetical protein